MNSLQRRGLVNGGIAAAITFVIGTVTVAALGDGSPPEPVLASPTGTSPSPTSTCEPSWEVVPSAELPGTSVTLQGVVALSPAEAWAVGSAGDPLEP